MADIQLTKPAEGENQSIPSAADGTYVLDFPQDEANIAREGDNLQFNFQDGSSITLENFYTNHNAENQPTFKIDGVDVASDAFFASMNNPDIAPAAGGAAAAAAGPAGRGGRYNEYGTSELGGGLDHLTRLDYNSDRSFDFEQGDYVLYPDEDGGAEPVRAAAAVNNPVTISPANPIIINPGDVPNIPIPGHPSIPGGPGAPAGPGDGNLSVGAPASAVFVREADLGNGPVTAEESLIINAPDGVGSITVAGVVVWENGQLAPELDRTIETDEGVLLITGFNPDTGELTYQFTLNQSTQEHKRPGEDDISHSFTVTVKDVDGDEASSVITVVISDDVPEATDDTVNLKSGDTVTGSVLTGSYVITGSGRPGSGTSGDADSFGQDGPANSIPSVTWDIPADRIIASGTDGNGSYTEVRLEDGASIKLYENGTYELTGPDVPEGQPAPVYTFNYTITDADGDTSSATLTINIDAQPGVVTPPPVEPPHDPNNPDSPSDKDPNNPGNPNDPDNPATPPSGNDPSNPDKPDDPDNPETPPSGPTPEHPYIPNVNGANIVVDEGALASGSGLHTAHGAAGSGSFLADVHGEKGGSIVLEAGGKTVTLNLPADNSTQISLSSNNVLSAGGVTVTITGAHYDAASGKWIVEYNYALQGSQNHDQTAGQDNVIFTPGAINITVTDGTGDTAHGVLTIEVHDDIPVVTAQGVGTPTPDQTDHTDSTLSGTFAVDFGADGPADRPFEIAGQNPQAVNGAYVFNVGGGVLTITQGQGDYWNYSFKPGQPGEVNQTFTISAIDGDGDRAQLNVTVKQDYDPVITPGPDPENPDNAPVAGGSSVVTVFDSGLENGSQEGKAPTTAEGSLTIDSKDGVSTIEVGGKVVFENGAIVPENSVFTTPDGVLTITGFDGTNLTYTYELKEPGDHSGGDNLSHTFDVTVTDPDGDSASASIQVNVRDDAPQASNDFNKVTEGAEKPVTGDVLANDKFGADGEGKPSMEWADGAGEHAGKYGTIILNPDGTYSYKLDNDNEEVKALTGKPGEAPLTETFTYTIYDADGDPSTATLTITINGINNPITVTPKDPDPEDPDNPDIPDNPQDPYVNASHVIVHEKGLADGSDSSASVTTKGQFEVNAPDGLASIVIGGKVVWENGALTNDLTIIDDATGTLTVTGFDGTNLTYEYTLKDNVQHDAGKDSLDLPPVKVTVTDADGDSASSSIIVTITDDAPLAKDDTASIDEGMASVSGDLLENDNYYADGKNADSYVELVSSAKGEYGTITLNPDGTYKFELDGDNEAVKGLKPGETLTQEYEYKIIDADGDVSTATLTITINGKDNPVTITPKDPEPENPDNPTPGEEVGVNGSHVIVWESGLDQGSAPGEGKTTAGSFEINAPDGLATIVVGGVTVWQDGALTDNTTITNDYGYLTITGYENGVLNYTYTLTDTATHPDKGQDRLDLPEIDVTVTDVDGSHASSNILVTIMDDAPVADNDFNKVTEGAEKPVTGNVLDNDTFGADGRADAPMEWTLGAGTHEGKYGSITLNADGTYSYKLDNNNEDVKALTGKDGETPLTETFTYTIYDKDGDPSQATLTITINGINNPVTITPEKPDPEVPGGDPQHPELSGASLTVREENLSSDDYKGSKPNNEALTQSGVMDITTPDGIKNLTFNGVNIDVESGAKTTFDVTGGTLTVWYVGGKDSGQLHYAFTLDKAIQDHSPKEKNDIFSQKFDVVVTDVDGDKAQSALQINIVDDAPKAVDDEASIKEGEAEVTGNWLDNDNYYADGPNTSGAKVELNADGKPHYGELTLNDDGTFTYKLNNDDPEIKAMIDGETKTDVFTYTIIDADGDRSEAQITITIDGRSTPTLTVTPVKDPDPNQNEDKDNPNSIPYTGNATIVVDEGALEGGSGQHNHHGASGVHFFTVDTQGEKGGKIELSVGGEQKIVIDMSGDHAINESVTVNGVKVTFTDIKLIAGTAERPETWQVNYTYELLGQRDHLDGNDKILYDGKGIDILVTDGSGDQVKGNITVEVHDDVSKVEAHDPVSEEGGYSVLHKLTFVTDKTIDSSTHSGRNDFLNPDKAGNAHFDTIYEGQDKNGNYYASSGTLGTQNGVNVFASTVQYYYDSSTGSWHIDEVRDRYGQTSHSDRTDGTAANSVTSSTPNGTRPTLVMSQDGLSLKSAMDGKDDDQISTKPGGGNILASEAVVLENINHTATYGLNIEFGKFDVNDKALVTFYLTPTSSNDDRIVSMQEVSFSDLKDGWVNLQVPDGFTKVIISALPNGDKFTDQTGFTIKNVDFTRPSWSHNGVVDFVQSADGANLVWDISELRTDLSDQPVNVLNTMNGGEYRIEFIESADGNSFKAVLRNPNNPSADPRPNSLDGNTLLDGSFDPATGKWVITQHYNFDLPNADDVKFNITFDGSDYDGDTAEGKITVDMSEPVITDRFQHTLAGNDSFKDTQVPKGTKAEDNKAKPEAIDFSKAADYLAGGSENDLIYGREGSDLLFGDGGANAYKDLNTAFKGSLTYDLDLTFKDISGDTTIGFGTGDNQAKFVQLQTALNKLASENPGEFEKALERLEALQKERDPGQSGDDALFGGLHADIMFGAGGDDYLEGNGYDHINPDKAALADKDMLFGGAGNDIILYDANDYIVHGGSGMDILLAGNKNTLTLDQLQDGKTHTDRPYVNGFEMLLTSEHTSHVENLGITSLQSLASYGIHIEGDSLALTGWVEGVTTPSGNKVFTYTHDNVKLKLEVSKDKDVRLDQYIRAGDSAQGGLGNDLIFTQAASNTLALQAGLLTVLGLSTNATAAQIAEAIKANPDAALDYLSKAEPGEHANAHGGGGDDVIFDNANNSYLSGDDNFMSDIDGALGRKGELIEGFTENLAGDTNRLSQIDQKLSDLENSTENKTDGNDQIYGGGGSEIMHGAGGDDLLNGMDGNDILIGGSGNDTLLGGAGNDILFGGSGNDFLDGGAGKDSLFGGAGNDLIVYDSNDYLIDGGDGIDVLLAGMNDSSLHLSDLLANKDADKPQVNDVEVLIKGVDSLSLTSMDDLASKLGIEINGSSMTLGKGWENVTPKGAEEGTYVFDNGAGVTIETNNMTLNTANEQTEQAVHQLTINNG